MRDFLLQTIDEKVGYAVDSNAPENVHPSEWDLQEILNELELIFPIHGQMTLEQLEKLDRNEMKRQLMAIGVAAYEAKEREVTPELMRLIESQYIMLPIIDRLWVDHLYVMDALKTGIGLRGYGQKDPRVEYEKEAYEIFEDLKNNIADEAIKRVFQIQIEPQTAFDVDGVAEQQALAGGAEPQMDPLMAAAANVEKQQLPDGAMPPRPSRLDSEFAEKLLGPAPGSNGRQREVHTNRDDDGPRKPVRTAEKVGRNDMCPCGSGKKFKRCHGVTA